MTDVFNSRFSIFRFLRAVAGELCPGLPVVLNTVLRSHEEELLQTSPRYLVLDVKHGKIRYDQPVDVSCALFTTAEFDPTTVWLQRFPFLLSQACLQQRTSADETMIALYDYDSVCGTSAVNSFIQNGTLPEDFVTILETTPPEVTYNGQTIGLKALPSTSAPVFDMTQTVYRAIWHIEFAFFHPGHVIGSNW